MPKHEVTCRICGLRFDLNSEQGVKLGNLRYAHQACAPEGELIPMEIPTIKKKAVKKQEPQELTQLNEYIKKLYKINYVPPNIQKQIKAYVSQYGFSYSGIYKTLYWFYEIKKKPLDESRQTIGIIPYIYREAEDYYYKLYLAEAANKDKDKDAVLGQVKEITIPPPEVYVKPPRLFNLEDEE